MDYNYEVKIEAEGEESNILRFIEWIKENLKEQTKICFRSSINYSGEFKEFDIFQHNLH
jgi:acylphosphatase